MVNPSLATFWNFLPSNSGRDDKAYSSTASTKYKISYPFLNSFSTNGDFSTCNPTSDKSHVAKISQMFEKKNRNRAYFGSGSAGDVINSVLFGLHSGNVISQRSMSFGDSGRLESE